VGSECCDRLLRTPPDVRLGIRHEHRLGIRHDHRPGIRHQHLRVSGMVAIQRTVRFRGTWYGRRHGPAHDAPYLERVAVKMLPRSNLTAGWVGVFVKGSFRGECIMKLVLEMIGCWILFSCVVGPCLTWAFFYSERRARGGRVFEQRPLWKAQHGATAANFPSWVLSTGLRPPS
jgi:hypothetical protein